MKKTTFVLCLLTTFVISANAQHRIGGDLGFGVGSTINNGENSKKSQTLLTFVIEPQYLYAINEKCELGFSMTLGTTQSISKSKYEYDDYNYSYSGSSSYKSRSSDFYWAINPTARYKIVGYEKFGFWVESLVTLGVEKTGSYSYSYEYGESKSEHTTNDWVKLHWGLNFNPVLTYQITDKFRMEAALGFLGLGLNGITYINDGDAKQTAVDFGVHLANGSITNVIDHANTIEDAIFDYYSMSELLGGRCIAKRLDLRIGFVCTL